jgi:hypothetical protein
MIPDAVKGEVENNTWAAMKALGGTRNVSSVALQIRPSPRRKPG